MNKRETSSSFLRAKGRNICSMGGRKLIPTAGLRKYTRGVISGGGIIHDVVAGVRLVTEGAKTETYFAIRADGKASENSL